MAYEIKKTERIREQLSINGDIFTTNISLNELSLEILKRRKRLVEESEKLSNIGDDSDPALITEAMKNCGEASIEFFECVFGAAETARLLTLYEGAYADMLEDVLPFILEVILPKVNAAIAQKRENRKIYYKQN
jgi:hypothetical protein